MITYYENTNVYHRQGSITIITIETRSLVTSDGY